MLFTEELAESTEEAHRASEKMMIVALKRIDSREDYIQMLSWLYGFYAPMEDLIHRQLTDDNFPDMKKRSRAEYICWDIKDSGLPIPTADASEQLPVIDSYYSALGALYVLEVTRLGGRIIAGMMCRALDSLKSLSFFNGYGAETANMWTAFKDLLNQPFTTKQRQEIIDTAEETFITFKYWIEKHELQPQV